MPAVGIGWRHPHYAALLAQQPALDFIEVHSENFFAPGGAARVLLREARTRYPVSLHGVGLSLGSATGIDEAHLDRLAALVADIEPVRVSDHACFARAPLGLVADAVHAADLLPTPFTREALDVFSANVARVQDRLKRPIAVENISAYLRPSRADMDEVQHLFARSPQALRGRLRVDMPARFARHFVLPHLPAFLHEILHHGPEGLGILRAAPALGSVCVGLWLARHPLHRNAGRVLLFAVAGFGLCVIGFGLSHSFWLSALILLFYGAFDGVSVVVRSTILQLATPEEMRGRVSSINGIFVSSSNELGAFYAGTMARLLGLVPAVIVGGFAILAVAGVTAWKAPRLRRLDLRELQ